MEGLGFWARVATGTGCWRWSGATQDGYGVHSQKVPGTRRTVNTKAHRMAWQLAWGPIPPGADVLHSCDVRACCRPSHLFLGDQAANNADRDAKGRQARGQRVNTARLTEADVLAIRAAAAAGVSQSELGRRYGVASQSIWAIVHRKTWRHCT